jgi:hypothetical protein
MPTESEKLANDPPKERGWYWVQTNPAWGNSPEVVYIGYPEYDDRLHVYGINPLHEIVTIEEYCSMVSQRRMK